MNQNNISLETVLHALYGCSNVQSGFTGAVYVCPTCAYGKDDGRPCESLHPLLDDAFALLKAQEPVKPRERIYHFFADRYCYDVSPRMVMCGACGEWLIENSDVIPRYKYCPQCGRKVKWE